MSRVVIQGDASGTGDFTIAAPNSNTDRTLTLPDEAGEVLVNGTTSNVGIGTSSPAVKLHVSSTGTPIFRIQDADGSDYYAQISQATGNTIFDTRFGASNGAFIFRGLGGGTADEYMRITSAGNVGIGIASPQELLHLQKTGGSTMRFQNPGVRVWNIGNNSTSFVFYDVTAAAERMRIHSTGMVTVATTAANASDGGVVFNTNGNVTCGNSAGSSGHEFATFRRSGSQIGSITQSGTTGVSYNTSSDYRLKENVVEITNGIDRVKLLNPSRFNFISDSDITVDGFLAHEVQEVVPEAIAGDKDATKEEEYEVTPAVLDDDGNVVTEAVMGTRTVPDYQGIDQSKLVPLLTAALQEAITKIEALEARVTALENA
jgi:hypothetical protein